MCKIAQRLLSWAIVSVFMESTVDTAKNIHARERQMIIARTKSEVETSDTTAAYSWVDLGPHLPHGSPQRDTVVLFVRVRFSILNRGTILLLGGNQAPK